VCRYYNPERKLMVVSAPSLTEGGGLAERLARTLAHKLIHHCQLTRGPLCNAHLYPELRADLYFNLYLSLFPILNK
jgi:hypothetical protein